MINKDDIPLVCIDSMNEMHFEEVEVINILLKQLESDEEFTILSQSIENLLEHMREHFSSEEKLMQERQYPHYRLHQGEHAKVLNEARYVEMTWRNRKDIDEIKEYLIETLLPWLDQHIKAMDVPLADYMTSS